MVGAIGQGFQPGGHSGVDFPQWFDTNATIHACRDGVVSFSDWNGGYGLTVIVDHGGGMQTLYAHQSLLNVHVGDMVAAGDVLGFVGMTGSATGVHLHFEVRLNGTPVNPVPYLI